MAFRGRKFIEVYREDQIWVVGGVEARDYFRLMIDDRRLEFLRIGPFAQSLIGPL